MPDVKRVFTTPYQNLYSSDYTQYIRSKTKYSTSSNLAKTIIENGGSLPMTNDNTIKTYKGPYTFSSTDVTNPKTVCCINQSRSYEDLLDITKGKYLLMPPVLNSTYIKKDVLQVSQLYNGVFFDFNYQGSELQLVTAPPVPENTIIYSNTDTDNYNQRIYVDNTYSLFYNKKNNCYTALFNFDYITLNNDTLPALFEMRRIQSHNILNGFQYPVKFALDPCLSSINDVAYDLIVPVTITNVNNTNGDTNMLYIKWNPPVLNGEILVNGGYRILYDGPTSGEIETDSTEYTLPIILAQGFQYSIYIEKQNPILTSRGETYFTSDELIAPLVISVVEGVGSDNTSVTIEWFPPFIGDNIITTGGYRIYKDGISITTISFTTTSYTITGLGPTAQSDIFVAGLDSNLNEIFDSQELIAPLVLTTTVNYINGININWLPPTLDGVSLVTSSYDISYNSVPGTSITSQISGDISVSPLTLTSYTIPLNYGLLYNIYITGDTFVSQTIQDTIIIPEVIVYNNPRVFPKSGSVSGEVGLVIGVPSSGSNPLTGYSQYSNVTITNTYNSSSVSLSLTGNFNKYFVYGEPSTAGPFITTLNPSIASNIAAVSINNIASGVAFGKVLRFDFSGGSSPSTYTCYYDPGNIGDAQGAITSMYYTISSTLPTIPPVPDVYVMKGKFFAQWKGFGGGNPNSIQEAWGISANSGSPTYAPIIQSGTPPNHAFYSEGNAGASYYYYNGLPKMIAPIYS